MNESTETSRKRLKIRPEILALFVSVGTLIIAASTFYFTSFRSVDKLTLFSQNWKFGNEQFGKEELSMDMEVRQVYANGGTDPVAILLSRLRIFPLGDVEFKKGSKEYRAFSSGNWERLSSWTYITEWQNSAVRLGPGDIKVIDANYRVKQLRLAKNRFGVCIQTLFMNADGMTHWARAPGLVFKVSESQGVWSVRYVGGKSTDLSFHAKILEDEKRIKKDPKRRTEKYK